MEALLLAVIIVPLFISIVGILAYKSFSSIKDSNELVTHSLVKAKQLHSLVDRKVK